MQRLFGTQISGIEGLELSFQKLQELELLLSQRLGYQSLKLLKSIALIGRLFIIQLINRKTTIRSNPY
jgi:hypothetical protein